MATGAIIMGSSHSLADLLISTYIHQTYLALEHQQL
jgi:hypothetical protein